MGGQTKPGGGVNPQVARTVRAKGMYMFKLRSFSLIAVHKHNAASNSSSPCSTGQHTFFTGSPKPICTNPPSTSKHSPSFSASIGHVFGVIGGRGGPPPPPFPGGGGYPPLPGVQGAPGAPGAPGVPGAPGGQGGGLIITGGGVITGGVGTIIGGITIGGTTTGGDSLGPL